MERLTGPPTCGDSLVEAALKVLLQPDALLKSEYTQAAWQLWTSGSIPHICPPDAACRQQLTVPDKPARSQALRICAPGQTAKRGKGGTLASRQALLHSLVHIESWATDLAWDAVARYGLQQEMYRLPRDFFDDFVRVAEDESRHFRELLLRLRANGSEYGALPAHDGLWQSAEETSYSLPARLSIEHCVHEARGLDVMPSTIHKFRSNGDEETALLLESVIYPEEITHCRAGTKWLMYLHQLAHEQGRTLAVPQQVLPPPIACSGTDSMGTCCKQVSSDAASSLEFLSPQSVAVLDGAVDSLSLDDVAQARGQGTMQAEASCETHSLERSTEQAAQQGKGDAGLDGLPAWAQDALRYHKVEDWFHALTRKHFWGLLKPPFNDAARAQAGFGPEWYLPLTIKPEPAAGAESEADGACPGPDHRAADVEDRENRHVIGCGAVPENLASA